MNTSKYRELLESECMVLVITPSKLCLTQLTRELYSSSVKTNFKQPSQNLLHIYILHTGNELMLNQY